MVLCPKFLFWPAWGVLPQVGVPLPLAILREGLTLFVTQADLKLTSLLSQPSKCWDYKKFTTHNLIFASYALSPSSKLVRQPLLVLSWFHGTNSFWVQTALWTASAWPSVWFFTLIKSPHWKTSGLPDSSYKTPFYQRHLKNGPTSLAK